MDKRLGEKKLAKNRQWRDGIRKLPLGFQDNIILWLSPDQKAIVGFDTLSQASFSQTIEPQGDTIIEFNFRKYILSVQNNNIALTPQLNENDF